MDLVVVGILGIIVLLIVLFFLGMPVGFAMGVERLILMLETLEVIPAEVMQTVDLYVCGVGEGASLASLMLADSLRAEQPWLRVQTHCGGGSFKSQMKKADKSGALFALLLQPSLRCGSSRKVLRVQNCWYPWLFW